VTDAIYTILPGRRHLGKGDVDSTPPTAYTGDDGNPVRRAAPLLEVVTSQSQEGSGSSSRPTQASFERRVPDRVRQHRSA
jgi:hypothetical protein